MRCTTVIYLLHLANKNNIKSLIKQHDGNSSVDLDPDNLDTYINVDPSAPEALEALVDF